MLMCLIYESDVYVCMCPCMCPCLCVGVSKRRAVRIVVLENMFDPAESNTDPCFFQDLETDLLEEGKKCGPIDKITVFSQHPKGVVIVKFATSFAAQECVRIMDGRFFGGKKLRCMFWDGVTNYSTPVNGSVQQEGNSGSRERAGGEDEDASRLDEFGDWLENEQKDLPDEFKLRVE